MSLEIGSYDLPGKGKRYIIFTEREEFSLKPEQFEAFAVDILRVLEQHGFDIPKIVQKAHDTINEFRIK